MRHSKTNKSDFEEFVSDPKRKKLFDQKYQELCLSEVVLSLMEQKTISVRALAKKMNVSPTVVQNIRSGKRTNITLDTLLGLTGALGAKLKLEIGNKVVTLKA